MKSTNAEKSIKKSKDGFDELIPEVRPAERVHPISTDIYDDSNRQKLTKVQFNVQSSFIELAWECLRRNRFYQALVDGDENALPESAWGYRWHHKVARTHGLIRLKPYQEAYQEGEPPAWTGLDSFAEQPLAPARFTQEIRTIELQPGQVAVVFDVAGIFAGQSPWQIQADAISEILGRLSKDKFKAVPLSGKSRHKNVLVRCLKLFDLLDDHRSLAGAASVLGYGKKQKRPKDSFTNSPFSSQSLQTLTKREPVSEAVTTAFEDANEMYNLIYRHGYIKLLQGERTYKYTKGRLTPHSIVRRSTKSEALKDWTSRRKPPNDKA